MPLPDLPVDLDALGLDEEDLAPLFMLIRCVADSAELGAQLVGGTSCQVIACEPGTRELAVALRDRLAALGWS